MTFLVKMFFKSVLNRVCCLFVVAVCLVSTVTGKKTKSQINVTSTLMNSTVDEMQKLHINLKLTIEIPQNNDTTPHTHESIVHNDDKKKREEGTEENSHEPEDSNEKASTEEVSSEVAKSEEESKEESISEESSSEELSSEEASSEEEVVEVKTENATSIEDHPAWRLVDNPRAPCGVSVSRRILGGMNAGLGTHPWVARLGRFKIHKGQYKGVVDWFCGGAVINFNYILTAAHCTNDPDFKVIRLGEYDANSVKDCDLHECSEIPQDFTPQSIVPHPKFVMTNTVTPHDIALVRLNTRINFNGWVAPVCLPRRDSLSLYTGLAEVIGWGKTTNSKKSLAAILQSVKIPITPGTKCMEGFFRRPNRGTFCAGGKRNEDSCCGDSGGPLLKKRSSGGSRKYFIIGVVSFGPPKCGNGVPAGYTNVSYHMKWILDNIKPYYLK